MKANEFVRNHGWEYTRGIIIACESGFLPKNQNYDDLKRLVESHELVASCGGLQSVKDTFSFAWAHGADELTEYGERLKQAIADIESCQ